MINENTTFKQYLKESGYSLMQYQEEVYHTCLAKSSKYKNIDLYFQDEIEQGFNDDASIEDTANTICEKFDDFFDKTNVEEEDEEYTLPDCDNEIFSFSASSVVRIQKKSLRADDVLADITTLTELPLRTALYIDPDAY